jgi:hypothetical protein
MTLLADFCQWLNDLPPSQTLAQSEWAFPIVESVHVLALGLVAGTVALVDLRVLGLALGEIRLTAIARRLLPLTWGGFAVMALSGGALFASEAVKLSHNPLFQLKLVLLLLAGLNAWIFHATVYRRVAVWEQAAVAPAQARVAAITSLATWTAIIIAGRFIAYVH